MRFNVSDEPVPGYRLVKFLGRGGFGEVWKATSPGGIHVALKMIDLAGREGLKEFKALRLFKSIHDSHLTPITAFWLIDEFGNVVDESMIGAQLAGNRQALSATIMPDRPQARELVIVMGLGDMSLFDRMVQCKEEGLSGIPRGELFGYMEDAARAIDFLNSPRHDLGHGPGSPILHCDIKPQNILIVGSSAQVCDFGLARELSTNITMTSIGVSLAYGAPECLEGKPPSATTDQYSLAISYVELRTGELPFDEPDVPFQVQRAHLEGKLNLSRLSAEEREVITKATDRDPAKRYPTAFSMIKALKRACPGELDSNATVTSIQRNDPAGRRISTETPSFANYPTTVASGSASAYDAQRRKRNRRRLALAFACFILLPLALGVWFGPDELSAVLARLTNPQQLREQAATVNKTDDPAGSSTSAEAIMPDAAAETPPVEPPLDEQKLIASLENSDARAVDEALAQLREALSKKRVTRLADVSRALTNLAERDSNYADRARDLVHRLAELDRSPAIVADLQRLFYQRTTQLIRDAPRPFDAKKYFSDLRALCEEAAADGAASGLTRIAETECLLEAAGEELSDELRNHLRHIVGFEKPWLTVDEQRTYENYVRLCAARRLGELSAAAIAEEGPARQALHELAASNQPTPGFGIACPQRGERAAAILLDAAISLRQPSMGDTPSLNAILRPYGNDGSAKAAAASDWLNASRSLFTQSGADARERLPLLANLALATWQADPSSIQGNAAEPLRVSVAELVGLQNELGADRWPIVYLDALLNPIQADKSSEIVKTRADLLEALTANDHEIDDMTAVEVCHDLIGKLLDDPRSLAAQEEPSRRQFARLYLNKALLIRKHPRAEWNLSEDAASGAWRLLDQAAALDPKEPNYMSLRGDARTNSIGMQLITIPAGEFQMGSPDSEIERGADESPQHSVRITRAFELSVHEVTQSEYEKVMETNPSWFTASGGGSGNVANLDTARFPVERVSCDDAQRFCRKLSHLEDRHYRLPTEAEWEYACRAGEPLAFNFGNALNGDRANCDGTMPYGASTRGPYLARTTAVGSYPPNNFGLFDMHGNVAEWCADWYKKDYYAKLTADDPTGVTAGSFRVLRGGSWRDNPVSCRSAFRSTGEPAKRYNVNGFRVVREF